MAASMHVSSAALRSCSDPLCLEVGRVYEGRWLHRLLQKTWFSLPTPVQRLEPKVVILGQQGRAGQLPGQGSQEHPCAEAWGPWGSRARTPGSEIQSSRVCVDFASLEMNSSCPLLLRPEKRHCCGKPGCLLQ